MAFALRPPDFFRLFESPPGGSSSLQLQCARSPAAMAAAPASESASAAPASSAGAGSSRATYQMFGGAYYDPSDFVPPLASVGREQLYDEEAIRATPKGAQRELQRCGQLRRIIVLSLASHCSLGCLGGALSQRMLFAGGSGPGQNGFWSLPWPNEQSAPSNGRRAVAAGPALSI